MWDMHTQECAVVAEAEKGSCCLWQCHRGHRPSATLTCRCPEGPWPRLSSHPSRGLCHLGSHGQGHLQEQNPPRLGLSLGPLQLVPDLCPQDQDANKDDVTGTASCPPRRKGTLSQAGGACRVKDTAPTTTWAAHTLRGHTWRLPGGTGAASAAGEVPNSREMMLRLGGAGATGCAGGSGASVRDVSEAEGVCWGSCGAGWGVLGLELPVDTALGGTTGDWEPEDGLCPLAARGAAWPRLRASIISRKLGGHRAGVRTLLPHLFLSLTDSDGGSGVPVPRLSSSCAPQYQAEHPWEGVWARGLGLEGPLPIGRAEPPSPVVLRLRTTVFSKLVGRPSYFEEGFHAGLEKELAPACLPGSLEAGKGVSGLAALTSGLGFWGSGLTQAGSRVQTGPVGTQAGPGRCPAMNANPHYQRAEGSVPPTSLCHPNPPKVKEPEGPALCWCHPGKRSSERQPRPDGRPAGVLDWTEAQCQ